MASELFTIDGKRKYLSAEELERFLKVANKQERGEENRNSKPQSQDII